MNTNAACNENSISHLKQWIAYIDSYQLCNCSVNKMDVNRVTSNVEVSQIIIMNRTHDVC